VTVAGSATTTPGRRDAVPMLVSLLNSLAGRRPAPPQTVAHAVMRMGASAREPLAVSDMDELRRTDAGRGMEPATVSR
jgi:hypothetical protein